MHLLHGRLKVHIYKVDRLHRECNFDFCRKDTKDKGKKFLAQVKSCVLCRPEVAGLGLYATVDLDKARVGRTSVVKGQRSQPKWDEAFHIYCAHSISNIIFTLKEDNPIGATLIGRAYIPADLIIKSKKVKRRVELLDEDHRPIPGGSKISVSVQFTHVANDQYCPWSRGIRTSSFPGIPHTFFRQRTGCKVTLYQDAHNDSIPFALLPRPGGLTYLNFDRCWEDIFIAIRDAKHFIYIAGWSIYTKISLVRIPNQATPDILGRKYPSNLGELLKMKADEEVTVLLLVWDDRTAMGTEVGLMGTHDKETRDYFKNTKVHCALCPRNPDEGRSILENLHYPAVFTHHQKLVVVDSEIPGGNSWKRIVTGFIGGIDLCHGRYDIPEHPLFSTLNSIHRDDFYQPNFPGASINKGGPREPWHDIHCKLEGPVAWDVMYNFEQRWLIDVGEQFLIRRTTLDQILLHPSQVKLPDNTETWNVQLFRSIDGGAVLGFPRNPRVAAELGIVSGKNNIIDRSIQDAYIHAIRRAQNFIYIENQYFIGSSYGWKSHDIRVEDIGALHLIPKELSLKIVSKIEAGERFSVYIVIPMWPEGVPESPPVQAILDWQRRTMEMMYVDIAEAIKKSGNNAHPRDYLTFFCLGNKEGPTAQKHETPQKPEKGSDYDRAQENRRFMIYVHSKMMIVDDEYIIVGSANINQRSMDGGRDTEIAIGAYQPHHLTRGSKKSIGRIYGFRKALWQEHLGKPGDPIFEHPETEECIRFVNHQAHVNWLNYADEEFLRKPFYHLLRYPVEVNSDGTITTLPDFEFFPDTKAPILGAKCDYIPSILTT